ncbi:MAG: hypothetical protein KGI49_00975 [Patescibacteria group bacterium]|nr:hypothetical protein [Patescibacteria group bacterium]
MNKKTKTALKTVLACFMLTLAGLAALNGWWNIELAYAAVIIAATYLIFYYARHKATANKRAPKRVVPLKSSRSIMSNPITGGMVVLIVGLIIIGGYVTWMGNLWGAMFLFVGIIIVGAGYASGSDEPYKLRLIKIWNNPVKIGSRYVSVAGNVILADYPPFYLGSTQIDMTWFELSFKDIDILSKDKVPATVSVAIIGIPDDDNLFDFDKAGQWKGIEKDMDKIVNKETERVCKDEPIEAMAASSSVVSDKLEPIIRRYITRARFGFKVQIVRADIKIPDDLKKKMLGAKGAIYETK